MSVSYSAYFADSLSNAAVVAVVAVGGGVADGVATRRTKVGKKNGMCRGKDGEVNERARGVEKRRDGPGVGRVDVGVVAAAGVV